MERSHVIALLVLGLVLGSFIAVMASTRDTGGWGAHPVVAVVHLDGAVVAGPSGGGLLESYTGSDEVVAQLREATEDPQIRAVVLRINSPGGTAPAAQEISAGVERLRRAGKPVVASLADMAASGGYWIAAQCDAIISNPATLTGSIGVLMEVVNLQELYDMLGMEFETIKSGPYKDLGSANRPLEEEERAILQSLVDDIYEQFIEAVVRGRNMDYDEVLALADGSVVTGRQAEALGLVDGQGDLEDAINRAAQLAGLERWSVRTLRRSSPWGWLLGTVEGARDWFILRGVPAYGWWGRQLVRLSGWE